MDRFHPRERNCGTEKGPWGTDISRSHFRPHRRCEVWKWPWRPGRARRSNGNRPGPAAASPRLPRGCAGRGIRRFLLPPRPHRRGPPAAGRGTPARRLGQAHLRRQLRGTVPFPPLAGSPLARLGSGD
jgi:hypothetical protein